jgi:hypothetical protein
VPHLSCYTTFRVVMETVIREQTEPATVKEVTFYKRNVVPSLPPTLTCHQNHASFQKRFEEYVPNSAGGRHIWKDWEHYVRSATANNMGVYDETMIYNGVINRDYFGQPSLRPFWYMFNDGFGNDDNPVIGIDVMYAKRGADGGFVPEPANLSDLLQTAHNVLLPQVKAELSILNSVYELKDFKSLPSIIQRIGKIPVRGRRALRELSRQGAGGFLFSEFAVRPLLSDIAKLRSAILRTQKRINDLVTRNGRVQRRHFQCRLPDQTGITDTSSFHLVNAGPTHELYRSAEGLNIRWRNSRAVLSDSYKFHVEMEYNYNYTSYQTAHAQLLGYLDALGINLNPQIIWNAIPWSFVIDWVFGINRWLGQFKVTNMDPQINIRRSLWSVVRDRTVLASVELKPTSPGLTADKPVTPICTVVERSYRRKVYRLTHNSIQLSGVNLKEFTLGAALVIARKWRRTKR